MLRNEKDFLKSIVQEAISSYLVIVDDIIWFLVKHRVMILGVL